MDLILTPGKCCPLCGKYYGANNALPPSPEWVDAYKLYALLEPHIHWGSRAGVAKTRFRDTPIRSADPDLQILYKLRRHKYGERMRAHIAERLLIRFDLDPRVDEILLQD